MPKKESFFQCLLILLSEQLLLFPVSFSVLTLLDFNTPVVYAVLLLSACVLMLIRIHFARPNRPVLVLVFTAGILILSYLWAGFSIKAIILFVFGMFTQLRALSISEQPLNSTGFYTFTAIGFFGYLAAAIYYNKEQLLPYMNLLAVCATLSALSVCICLNMLLVSYEKAAGSRTGNIPRLSRKSNRLMLTIFMVLILVFTAIGFADQIYAFLGMILMSFINFLNSFFSSDTTQAPTQPQSPPFMGEKAAASPFWSIIEYILRVLTIIALIAAVLYLLYRLAVYLKKYYRQMLKKLFDRMANIFRAFLLGRSGDAADDLGYEDEISSLMNNKDNLLSATRRWLSARSKSGRPYMMLQDNAQRARWLYTHIVQKSIKKGTLLKKTMTPKQILSHISDSKDKRDDSSLSRAISCYHEARYGSQVPDEAGIEALRAIGKKH